MLVGNTQEECPPALTCKLPEGPDDGCHSVARIDLMGGVIWLARMLMNLKKRLAGISSDGVAARGRHCYGGPME
jgi:hypothetical protein